MQYADTFSTLQKALKRAKKLSKLYRGIKFHIGEGLFFYHVKSFDIPPYGTGKYHGHYKNGKHKPWK